jgi:hypothetical protein
MDPTELESSSFEVLGLKLKQVQKVIEMLEGLRLLSGVDKLYTQRIVGLSRSSVKKDPLECTYVRMALKELILKHSKEFGEMRVLIKALSEVLGE